jgi:prepilin-type N-terminal cleavage/methylation domain-containing protein
VRQAGFTLVELLVVVFLLSAVALSAVSFVSEEDAQLRYEDTRTRLESIRSAIGGHPAQATAGKAPASGFYADVGRYPSDPQELLEQSGLPAYAPSTGVGWRGPYLRVLPTFDGSLRYPDGWGRDWTWTEVVVGPGPELRVVSAGDDGVFGAGAGYAADFPADATPALLVPDDVTLDLQGWQVFVELTTTGGLSAQDLSLELLHPQDGAAASATSSPQTVTLAPGTSAVVGFDYPAGAALRVAWGRRALRIVDDTGAVEGAGPAARVLLVPRGALPTSGATAPLFTWSLDP